MDMIYLYTCNGHENVNNKDTDLRMLIKVFDVRWSVDSTLIRDIIRLLKTTCPIEDVDYHIHSN